MSEQTGAALQLISSGGVYGAERVVLDLASHLKEAGLGSHVVAIESPGADAVLELARAAGLRTFKLVTRGRPLWHATAALREYIRAHDVRIVHAHGYKADLMLAMARVARLSARLSTCHTWYRENLKMRVYERLDKLVLRGFDHVVAVSPQLVQELAEAGVPPEKVSLIYNGTSLETAAPDARSSIRAQFGVARDEFLITRLGRLSVAKGNDLLLRAFARLPQSRLKLLLAGEGEERENLERLARELGLAERVIFAGYRTDVANLLAATDLFVMSSTHEGLPIVMLEAMAAAVPIVSTDVGAIGLALESGRNSWLVPGGDHAALAGALSEAIERADLRSEYAGRAYADYVARFSRKAMGDAYLDLYRRLSASRALSGENAIRVGG